MLIISSPCSTPWPTALLACLCWHDDLCDLYLLKKTLGNSIPPSTQRFYQDQIQSGQKTPFATVVVIMIISGGGVLPFSSGSDIWNPGSHQDSTGGSIVSLSFIITQNYDQHHITTIKIIIIRRKYCVITIHHHHPCHHPFSWRAILKISNW